MEPINIITHQDRKIVFFDGKNMSEQQLCENTEKFTTLGITNDINLYLLDVSGTHTTPKVRDASASSVKRTNNHFGKAYYALVGLSLMQRVVANVLTKNQYFSENIEDAKNWLVSKANKG